jgi:hypothetical protein
LNRRKFLTGLAVGAGLAPLSSRLWDTAQARRAPLCVPTGGSGSVLSAQDFSYLGYYDIQTNGMNTTFSQGLTHRYVNGDLRFLIWQHGSDLHEISLAGKSFGDQIKTKTNSWHLGAGIWSFKGFWWDEAQQRLWSVTTKDYEAIAYGVQLFTRTLNANGTESNVRGPIGLQGIPAKRVYGGVQPVPPWFQAQYGVAPYVVGWGGYTSLVRMGGGASLGPTMYTMPDPTGFAPGTEVPASQFKVLMDHIGGTMNGDWYDTGSPTNFDRGSRLTIPLNYFDGNDPRQNPTGSNTRPTQPLTSGQWLSPAPDGFGRFVWGDNYFNTGCWIDGPSKQGVVLIASLGGGACWYANATLNFDRREFEAHVFDPAHLGQVAQGTRKPWHVKPTTMVKLDLPGLEMANPVGNIPRGNAGGATYDPVTRRLYIAGFGVNTYFTRLYVFNVNA